MNSGAIMTIFLNLMFDLLAVPVPLYIANDPRFDQSHHNITVEFFYASENLHFCTQRRHPSLKSTTWSNKILP